jgi:alpha-L-fucosidase
LANNELNRRQLVRLGARALAGAYVSRGDKCSASLFFSKNSASAVDLARPTREQLAFQDMELGVFIHYSIDTYGSIHGAAPAATFNPTELNAEQWVLAAKSMGAKYIVLTARHEQGFCLWPTKTTDYSIKSSPYKGGKGDIVKEFVEACRRNDIKPGLYNPPWIDDNWDARQAGFVEQRDNASITKYDDTSIFQKVLEKETEQLRELMAGYGPLVFIWDDHFGRSDSLGAKPQGGQLRELYATLAKLAHQLQPKCLYFGPDIEHVGNENGVTTYPLWNPVTTLDGTPYTISTTYKWGGNNTGDPLGKIYRPRLGCTTNGFSTGDWFYTGPHQPKSLEKHMEVYYQTVGRGAGVIINLPPDRRGLIPEDLVASAKEFGDEIHRRFSNPVGITKGRGDVLTMRFPSPRTFDNVVTMEDLADGQKIAKYQLEARVNDQWKVIAEGQTVGHKRIDQLDPITAMAIRFTVTEALAKPVLIRSLAAYDSQNSSRVS